MTLPRITKGTALLAGIIVLALVLRIWNLWNVDVQYDAAINLFRALGWFDYLSDQGQTSPLVWFGYIPWWAKLSFHDHPPLVFAINKFFLELFGDSSFIALLPYALAGTITTWVTYGIGAASSGKRTALIAAAIYAVASYAIWGSRTAYLEGMQVVFIALSIWFFVLFLKHNRYRYLLLWAAALGCALLSKYTALFLIPPAVLAIFVWKREWLRQWRFWLAPFVTLLVLTPAIVYNWFVFQTRGHFDAALSSIVGMRPEDFSYIAGRSAGFSFGNISNIIDIISTNTSVPLLLAIGLGIAWTIVSAFRKRLTSSQLFLLLNLISIMLLFCVMSPAPRFVSIIMPLFALVVAFGFETLLSQPSRRLQKQAIALLIVVLVTEGLFAVNTNLLARHIGTPTVTYGQDFFHNRGFTELDGYLRKNVYPPLPKTKNAETPEDLIFDNEDVILVDERMDWFALMWHFRRYLYFYNFPVLTFNDVFDSLENTGVDDLDALSYLKALGAKSFWFVYVAEAGVDRPDIKESYVQKVNELKAWLDESGIQPVATFQNDEGETTFILYHFDFVVEE